MTSLLNILSKIDSNDTQSLLCDVPKDLIDGLNVQEDGSVDLSTLLKICLRMKRKESLKSIAKRQSQVMDLIYNSDIAADFEHKKQQ